MALSLKSSAFQSGGEVPSVHTCEGKDASPPLEWSSMPPGTKSLALIVDDPDAPDPKAPKMTWVHWVLYGIPPSATGLARGDDFEGPARRRARGHQRLEADRIRWPVSTHRTTPLLLQTLRTRRRPARSRRLRRRRSSRARWRVTCWRRPSSWGPTRSSGEAAARTAASLTIPPESNVPNCFADRGSASVDPSRGVAGPRGSHRSPSPRKLVVRSPAAG